MTKTFDKLYILEHSNIEPIYLDHLEIKYRVFVDELGWNIDVEGKKSPRCVPDTVDKDSLFLTSYTESHNQVGTVRATPLGLQFPHRDLFANHFNDGRFSTNIENLCSINALAVLPEYRRKIFAASPMIPSGTAAMKMMVMLNLICWRRGFKGAIATSSNPWATLLFKRLGFLMIDKPFKTGIYNHHFINYGIAFGSEAHLNALSKIYHEPCMNQISFEKSSLSEYFIDRQALLL
jgi:hypothetical protein